MAACSDLQNHIDNGLAIGKPHKASSNQTLCQTKLLCAAIFIAFYPPSRGKPEFCTYHRHLFTPSTPKIVAKRKRLWQLERNWANTIERFMPINLYCHISLTLSRIWLTLRCLCLYRMGEGGIFPSHTDVNFHLSNLETFKCAHRMPKNVLYAYIIGCYIDASIYTMTCSRC